MNKYLRTVANNRVKDCWIQYQIIKNINIVLEIYFLKDGKPIFFASNPVLHMSAI